MGLSFHSDQIQEREPALGTRSGTSLPTGRGGAARGANGQSRQMAPKPRAEPSALGPVGAPRPFPASTPPEQTTGTKGE